MGPARPLARLAFLSVVLAASCGGGLPADRRSAITVSPSAPSSAPATAAEPSQAGTASDGFGDIARIDPARATVTARVGLPGTGDQSVCGMCVDNVVSSVDSIWVPLNFGKELARIDPTTNAVAASIPMAGPAETVAEGNGAIWSATWDGSIPCTDAAAEVVRVDPGRNADSGTSILPCAITVAVAAGDLWVGTADAPNGVTRLHIRP